MSDALASSREAPRASFYVAAVAKAAEIAFHIVESEFPVAVIARTHTSEISATRSPYSISEAPSSSRRKNRRTFVIKLFIIMSPVIQKEQKRGEYEMNLNGGVPAPLPSGLAARKRTPAVLLLLLKLHTVCQNATEHGVRNTAEALAASKYRRHNEMRTSRAEQDLERRRPRRPEVTSNCHLRVETRVYGLC